MTSPNTVENKPQRARDHFYGLREAKRDLVGLALFDRLDLSIQNRHELRERMWKRREIENYLCTREVLVSWARDAGGERTGGPLFAQTWVGKMEESIAEIEKAMETLGKGSPWSPDTKVSDDFLDPLFAAFFKKLGLPNLMRKNDYHVLTRYLSMKEIDPEVSEVLDLIAQVANQARPLRDEDGS